MRACSSWPWYPKQGSLSSPTPTAGQECSVGKVWHQFLIQHTASGQTQFWGQNFATWKRGIWSKPVTYRLCMWRDRKRHLWGQVLVHPAERCCSLVWSAGWALHQHTGILPTFQPHFSHWLPVSLLSHQGLAQNTEWDVKNNTNGMKEVLRIGRGASNISYPVDQKLSTSQSWKFETPFLRRLHTLHLDHV